MDPRERTLALKDENERLRDDLRDALALAAEELRVRRGYPPRSAWLIGARRLVAEVWRLVEHDRIDARSPAADAALDLRDVIDPDWQPVAEAEREAAVAPHRLRSRGAPLVPERRD